MKRIVGLGVAALSLAASAGLAHTMYLKLGSYFVAPGREIVLELVNGTYDRSENAIARDRMLNASLVGPGAEVVVPPVGDWWDEEDTTWLKLTPETPGTYLFGVSTRARELELAAADFNDYLEHDGVADMLEARERQGKLDEDANELYSKHVKTIFQVGDARTDAYRHRLGYPIEIVPLVNPYDLGGGDRFGFVVERAGEPVPDQLFYASHAGYHEHAEEGGHVEAVRGRTDNEGIGAFELTTPGKWYVRLIHMVEVEGGELTHESNWATLTFEIAE